MLTNPSAADVRSLFLKFFESKNHTLVASSPVVPHDDPTLMFTNAGMNQFKGVFLGDNPKGLKCATSSQKCIRAGGKHNDLENVGKTARHLTFFEMLGNFSFGDYFKEQSIKYAWEFLTSSEWLAIPKEKLLVTVYASDDEAYDIWNKDLGLAEDKIIRIGDNKGSAYASDNFWQMGDTGPCGPCSEIFYDHGAHIWGGPPGSENEDGDRFIEIWNNVFMQFNRDESGAMNPLPQKCVDTGMGLERITALLNGYNSNYKTDIFETLTAKVASESGVAYSDEEAGVPHRVISDHLRTIAFSIADGVMPSNEGRGYVVRRILRRASRYARKLGQKQAFLVKLLPTLIDLMGEAYPELVARQSFIANVIATEEERFLKTLDVGLGLFDKLAIAVKADSKTILPGEQVFQLYDTYGFPADLTRMLAEENGLETDEKGFEKAMAAQKERARSARQSGISVNTDDWQVISEVAGTEFFGYESSFRIMKISRYLDQGEGSVLFVSPETVFYAEGGGQDGEQGELVNEWLTLKVIDTLKVNDVWVHKAKVVSGEANTESMANDFRASVSEGLRSESKKHHSATHLLQEALVQVLGDHVQQQGSKVGPSGLRFDFTQPTALTVKQLAEVETLVNHQIALNLPIETKLQNVDEAKASGATALFGEKYEEDVRVVSMGEFSKELCGGLHVSQTSEIGLIKIVTETSTAAGVRRIEALVVQRALELFNSQYSTMQTLQGMLKAKPKAVLSKVEALADQVKQQSKEIEKLQGELAALNVKSLLQDVKMIEGVDVSILSFDNLAKKEFEKTLEAVADRHQGVAILANFAESSASMAITVNKSLHSKVKAGNLVKSLAEKTGARGGGRPDRAQAGCKEPAKLQKWLKDEAESDLAELLK
jgi:alanyl-tRNA synthetase